MFRIKKGNLTDSLERITREMGDMNNGLVWYSNGKTSLIIEWHLNIETGSEDNQINKNPRTEYYSH